MAKIGIKSISQLRIISAAVVAVATPQAALATSIVHATQQNVMQQFANVQAGQTLVLQGRFTEFALRDRDFGGVTVDASAAHFAGGFSLRNVHNITFKGGTYGLDTGPLRKLATVEVFRSSNVSFAYGEHLGWNLGRGIGISIGNSQFVTVRDSNFTNMRLGLGYSNVSDGLIARNSFSGLSSDGVNIVSSYRVIASHNHCSNFAVSSGSHPDCIQLWSLNGNPVQSDIMLLNNVALGNVQGFTSFDSRRGGGLRITMAGNYVNSDYPQGIACSACFDSIFTDNILIAKPGARWRTSLNLMGGGNNILANNQFYDNRNGQLLIPSIGSNWINWVPGLAGKVGSAIDDRNYGMPVMQMSSFTDAVPETATWVMLLFGFAATGRAMRKKHHFPTAFA